MQKIILSIFLFAVLITPVLANTYGSDFLVDGTATADSEYSTNVAAQGKDGNQATPWTSAMTAPTHWWKYDLGSGILKEPAKIALHTYCSYDSGDTGSSVKDFQFQGSNDNSNFYTLYSSTSPACTNATRRTDTYEFTASTTGYRYFKFNLTSSNRPVGFTEIYEAYAYECLDCNASTTTSTMQENFFEYGTWLLRILLVLGSAAVTYKLITGRKLP